MHSPGGEQGACEGGGEGASKSNLSELNGTSDVVVVASGVGRGGRAGGGGEGGGAASRGRETLSPRLFVTHHTNVAGVGRGLGGLEGWGGGGGVDSLPPDQLPPYTGARTNL
jgi:hypothetical protein